jgi:hypothetical protein
LRTRIAWHAGNYFQGEMPIWGMPAKLLGAEKMVNVRTPANPVNKRGLWPPKNSKPYPVHYDDDWWKVAKAHNIPVWDLIEFNFQTLVPEEVNWYLRELVGCKISTDKGRNYSFQGADPAKSKIYVPLVQQKIAPKDEFKDVMERFKLAVEVMNHPRKTFLLCIIDKIMAGGDDRVIQWSHIAPKQILGFANLKVRKKGPEGNVTDDQWLYNNIKAKGDVERQPTGAGFSGRFGFVTSMRKYVMEMFRYWPDTLQGTVNEIFETHDSLDTWGRLDSDQGGGEAMPREYRAIRDWVMEKEGNPTTVLSCVVSIGWVK